MIHSGSIVTDSIHVAQIIKLLTLLKADKHIHNYFTICKTQTSVMFVQLIGKRSDKAIIE